MDELKFPRIIARGPFTLASPISELNVLRKTSDLIGNNYSPLAKNLDIKNLAYLSDKSKLLNFKKTLIIYQIFDVL